MIGCGVNGAWAARCLAAAGYGEGSCSTRAPRRRRHWLSSSAGRRHARRGGRGGRRRHRHPGGDAGDPGRRPASGPAPRRARRRCDGKGEVELDALARCSLFCDEWVQASKGGELSGAVAAGTVDRARVTEIGGAARAGTRTAVDGRDHPVRLHGLASRTRVDRPRDPGPRDRHRRARGRRNGACAAADHNPLSRLRSLAVLPRQAYAEASFGRRVYLYGPRLVGVVRGDRKPGGRGPRRSPS